MQLGFDHGFSDDLFIDDLGVPNVPVPQGILRPHPQSLGWAVWLAVRLSCGSWDAEVHERTLGRGSTPRIVLAKGLGLGLESHP